MKNKIFMIYLRTGGGHLAPARSVAKYIDKDYQTVYEPVLVDGLEGTSKTLRFIVEDGYRILQNRAKWYYEFLYAINKITGLARFNNLMITRAIKPVLEEKILREKPLKIILFHFFLIEPVIKVLQDNNLNIPVTTVVTDPFIAHPVWFLYNSMDFIVFSQRLKDYAVSKGIDKNRVHCFPFVLDEKYSKILSDNENNQLRIQYGLDSNKKVILILGGGDGIPKGKAILRGLLEKFKDVEIIMVCAKNKNLFNYASRLKEKMNCSNLRIYGFVDFIYELINISDIVITKCGASTFMEILLQKKIPVVNSYIWEQEKGNVEFLVDNKLGIYENKVIGLPSVIDRLLSDPCFYNSFINNINKADLENGTAKVGDFIVCS